MTRRLLSITAWLAFGHALLLGLFWSLLQVPESNTAMLVVSVVVAAAIVAAAGWVEAVALGLWVAGTSWRESLRRARIAPVPAVVALTSFGVIWLLTAHLRAAWFGHTGEIDAWLMQRLGWTRTAGLHSVAGWVIGFIRFVVGGLIALTILAWALAGGMRALARPGRWLGAAPAPRPLVVGGLLFHGLVWLPWRAAFWRPAWLAPNWQEAAFAAVKLGLLYAIANLGWATILRLVQDGAARDGNA
jgi:hypothetical protein